MPDPATPTGGSSAPSPVRTRTKVRRHYRDREHCGTYVRELCNSRLYQLRFWCPLPGANPYYASAHCGGAGLSVHAGIYPTIRDAKTALKAILPILKGCRPIDVWRAVRELQDQGTIPVGRRGKILPLWVRRVVVKGGCGYVGVLRREGLDPVWTPTQKTPEAAHMILWEKVTTPAAG